MPLLKIQTNQSRGETEISGLMKKASSLVAAELGKPESYVMIAFEPPHPMLFAGSDDPLAYLELKSIGLPEEQTKNLSARLSQLISNELKVPAERIYIEFSNAPRKMWGWNGGTF